MLDVGRVSNVTAAYRNLKLRVVEVVSGSIFVLSLQLILIPHYRSCHRLRGADTVTIELFCAAFSLDELLIL